MTLSLFDIWKNEFSFGFDFISVDNEREDGYVFALLGLSYNKEDRKLYFDIFWKCFEFNIGIKIS